MNVTRFLTKNSFIIAFKRDNFFLFKSGMFVKKWYLSDGLSTINAMSIVINYEY